MVMHFARRPLAITGRTALVLGLLLLAGCYKNMMETPVILREDRINPYVLTPEDEQSTKTMLFYATDRDPKGSPEKRSYGNGQRDTLRLGTYWVEFGNDLTWDELVAASLTDDRRVSVPLKLQSTEEYGALTSTVSDKEASRDASLTSGDAQMAFARRLDRALAGNTNRNLAIYVHGFKVDFYNSCVVSAELHHFLARNTTVLAYAWPSGQSAWGYGGDIGRGEKSAPKLARLIEFLSANTDVENINILAYSAGATVVTDALVALGEKYADASDAQREANVKLGNVIFVAGDVDAREFALEDLPKFYDLADQIEIGWTPGDAALSASSLLHLGGSRLGVIRPEDFSDEEIQRLRDLQMTNVEFIDVAENLDAPERDRRLGHGYWYKNTWVSSDILMGLRFDLRPGERGLAKSEKRAAGWYFPDGYPDKVFDAVMTTLRERNDPLVERVEAHDRK